AQFPVPSEFRQNGGIKTVAFLPGSRESEMRHHLRPMKEGFALARKAHANLRAIYSLPDANGRRVKVEAAASDPMNEADLPGELSKSAVSHSSLLPSIADFSVVKSGTSTLEAG